MDWSSDGCGVFLTNVTDVGVLPWPRLLGNGLDAERGTRRDPDRKRQARSH